MSGARYNNDTNHPISEQSSESLFMNDFNITLVGDFQVNKDVVIDGNVNVAGNVTIDGELTAVNSTSLNVKDNHVFLNNGYTATPLKDGGLVVNRGTNGVSSSQADVTLGGSFTPGAGGNPTVVLDSASVVFAVSDLIQVSGSEFNDGIYEVLSQPDATLTIRGIGVTPTTETWTQNQFVAETPTSTSIDKINVTVLKSDPTTGLWEQGQGNQTGITFEPIEDKAAGADTQVQFNDNGEFGADAELTYDQTNNVLSVPTLSIVDPILLPRKTFSTTTDTGTLGFASLYACTDTTVDRVLTILNSDMARGTELNLWEFDIKDETGELVSNATKITVTTETLTVSTAGAGASGTNFTATDHELSVGSNIIHSGFTDSGLYDGPQIVTLVVDADTYEVAAITFSAPDSGSANISVEGVISFDMTVDFSIRKRYSNGINIFTR